MNNEFVEDIKWTKRLEEIEGFPRGSAYCIMLGSERRDGVAAGTCTRAGSTSGVTTIT